MTMPAKEAFSVSCSVFIHEISYFQILEVLDFLDFSFDLKVLFVIKMGLCSADIEKLVSSSLDDEVIIDPSHGHLRKLMLSTKSNLNEF